MINLDGNKYEWIDTQTKQTYTVYAKTQDKADKELRKYLTKIGKLEVLERLQHKKLIKKIGTGSHGYENYEIGVGENSLCYIRLPHCDWELAGW